MSRILPLLPLRGVIVFPYTVLHLDVGRERSINAIEAAMVRDREIFLAMQKEAQTDDPGEEDIYATGTVAEIKQLLKLPGGTIRILVEGLRRGKIIRYLSYDPYMAVEVQEYRDEGATTNEIEALMRTLINEFEHYVKMSKRIPPETVVA